MLEAGGGGRREGNPRRGEAHLASSITERRRRSSGGGCRQHGSLRLPPPGSSVKVNLPHSAKSIGGGDLITLAGAPALPISFFPPHIPFPHLLLLLLSEALQWYQKQTMAQASSAARPGSDHPALIAALRLTLIHRHGRWGGCVCVFAGGVGCVEQVQDQDQNPIAEIQGWWWWGGLD